MGAGRSGFGIAWEDTRVGPQNVMFARLDATGVKIGSDLNVTMTQTQAYSPSLMWTGSEYGLAWTEFSPGTGAAKIRFRRLDATGAALSPTMEFPVQGQGTDHSSIAWDGLRVVGAYQGNGIQFGSVYCDCLDADSDGYSCSDCNDSAGSVHPNASETCNSLDDDCDSQIDEGLEQTRYRDVDADGYGDPTVTQVTCFLPAGWSAQAGDCNDADPLIHPGMTELCDGIDQDCDSAVDEDSAGVDSDADGVHNACDNCRFAFNPTQLDTDGDLVGNACDNCALLTNPGQADTDSDQRGNACDNCPTAYNPFQDDFDSDRVGDACDNCAFDFNPPQSDGDHDNEGDRCDSNDGVIYIFSTDPNYIEWQVETGPSSWSVYEGDLSVLRSTGVYSQAPGSNPLAHRACGVSQDYIDDFEAPPAGGVKFALVTGRTSGLEGSLGTNSAGATRPNANPCP